MNNDEIQVSGIRERTEVTLHVSNDLGVLAKLFASLSEEVQGIDAWRFYTHHERAAILIITKTESRIPVVLRTAGFECETNLVLVLEEKHHRVSPLRLSAELRASGMRIVDAYTCSSCHNGTCLVLKTTDSPQAAAVLAAIRLHESQPIDAAQGVDIPEDEMEIVHPSVP